MRWCARSRRRPTRRAAGRASGGVGHRFTGGYALAMAVDDTMIAPVLQPTANPLRSGAARAASIDMSRPTRARPGARGDDGPVRTRAALHNEPGGAGGPGSRCCAASWATRHRDRDPPRLGTRTAQPGAHSVLTVDLVDEPGIPPATALDAVLDFYRTRLLAGVEIKV